MRTRAYSHPSELSPQRRSPEAGFRHDRSLPALSPSRLNRRRIEAACEVLGRPQVRCSPHERDLWLALTRADTQLSTGAHVRTIGKGRKETVAPLTTQTVAVLRVWMRGFDGDPESPLFPSRDDRRLSRYAIERRLARHVATARHICPTLRAKRITMHVLRHTAAMTLLGAGIDTSTIALWLGHEQDRTTHVYFHADLALKQRTLDRITPPTATPAATKRPTPSSPSWTTSDLLGVPDTARMPASLSSPAYPGRWCFWRDPGARTTAGRPASVSARYSIRPPSTSVRTAGLTNPSSVQTTLPLVA
jgi:hypothetical protein